MRKALKIYRITVSCPVFLPNYKFRKYYQKTLEKQGINFSNSALFHMNTGVSLKTFAKFALLGNCFSDRFAEVKT